MNCKELERYAIEFMEGAAFREREAVEQHLAACPACAERLRVFSDVSRLLDGWEGIQPSATFDTRLGQRIAAQPVAPGWWERLTGGLLRFPSASPALAGAALAVVLVAVALVRYDPFSLSTPATEPQPAPVTLVSADADELTLYQDLPVLENWDMLSNFEVLQELNGKTP